jgi:hypothetical protein
VEKVEVIPLDPGDRTALHRKASTGSGFELDALSRINYHVRPGTAGVEPEQAVLSFCNSSDSVLRVVLLRSGDNLPATGSAPGAVVGDWQIQYLKKGLRLDVSSLPVQLFRDALTALHKVSLPVQSSVSSAGRTKQS